MAKQDDELLFGRCTDGLMHVVDEELGPAKCGVDAHHVDEGDDDTECCDECVDIIARSVGVEPEIFRRRIAARLPN
jgi:hypothetical protein